MKILHLTDHFPPALGGIETHVASLARRQAGRGDEVTVLTSGPATADGRHERDSGPVTVLRAPSFVDGWALDFAAFDVVHAHVSVVAPFTAPLAARAARRGAPTVVTVHSLWSGMGPVPAAAAGLCGLLRAPVQWTAVSRVAAEQLRRRLPGHPHVRVLPNAVDVPARRATPVGRSDGSVRLVSTMRIARRKRPLQLIRMFDALRRSVDVPVALTVVGDGPMGARLERHVHRAGLQDLVALTGRLAPADVARILVDADLYVAPAVLESFGLAALEARSVGLPVVGHSTSGLTDFVRSGVDGLLGGSDDEIVDRLRDLVLDGEQRWRISEHNRTVATGLTWPNTLRHHDATYALVCRRSGVRPAAADLRTAVGP